uniref:NADH-ubiquinone oxidoreductase chain 2 n=1 Tax=Typhlodromus pineus TaxID=3061201 RepID=A0AAU6QDU6_9ACAR
MSYSILKLLTYLILFLSLIFTFSSKNYFMIWMGLEMNLIMYLMISSLSNSQSNSNSMMKYYMIQSLSSNFFFLSIIMKMNDKNFIFMNCILILSMWMKLGFFPFSGWFFQMSENLNWNFWFLLNFFQKLIPLMIISMNFINNNLIIMLIFMNFFYCIFEIFFQTSIRWMMNCSSMNHFNWMLISIINSKFIWHIYLFIYSILFYFTYKFLKNNNINSFMMFMALKTNYFFLLFFLLMLNYMGLPPFMGFIPKILILKFSNYFFMMLILLIFNILSYIIYMYFILPLLILNMYKYILYFKTNNTIIFFMVSIIFFMVSIIFF